MSTPNISERERARRERQREGSAAERRAYTMAEWAAVRRISKSMLYKLLREGRGPRTYYVGTRRFGSAEADAEWARQCEAEAERR
jgi:predicted DNA-binding transcriptional regulator AlpA